MYIEGGGFNSGGGGGGGFNSGGGGGGLMPYRCTVQLLCRFSLSDWLSACQIVSLCSISAD